MKKRVKKRKSFIIKNKNLIIIIIGIILIAAIIYIVIIKTDFFGEDNSDKDKTEEANIIASFEWREPKTITPYGGRFYDKCDDGKNLGKVWASVELQTPETNLSFTCKATIIAEDTQKIVDASQLNLGTDRTKSGFIGFTEELAKKHLIEVCCKSKEEGSSFCKTFELNAYC